MGRISVHVELTVRQSGFEDKAVERTPAVDREKALGFCTTISNIGVANERPLGMAIS